MNISTSANTAFRAITHPSGFETGFVSAPKGGTADSKLSARHDNAVLQAQQSLVDAAGDGHVSKESFVELARSVEAFEVSRAEKRGDGLTREETLQLKSELRQLKKAIDAGKSPEQTTEDAGLGNLYEDLTSGVVDPKQAVEELNWRAQKSYGAVVANRPGPVFFDERAKGRAALAKDIDPQAKPSWTKASSDGKYHPGTVDLVRTAISLFPKLDANGDGIVNRAEARSLLTSYQDLGITAAQATTLYAHQADMVEALDPGPASHEKLTLGDLGALLPENAGQAPAKHVDEILTQVSYRLKAQEAVAFVPEVPLYLSADGPNPLKVNQGKEGSCWFLGVLPTLTKDELSQVLVAKDDHFEMRLPGGIVETVTPLNEAERRVYSNGNGAWSGLLEKGVSQLLGRSGDDITGGYAKDGLQLLTGADADGVSIMNAPEPGAPDLRDRAQLAKLLDTTMQAGGAIFTHAYNEDFDGDLSLITGRNHAYTMTGYNAAAQTVELRNPWGNGEKADRDGINDGNFELTLTEFAANYSYMYVEKTA